MHSKDLVPKKERPNVVYHILRGGCPATYMYVGQTKRMLEKRINEHRRAVQKAVD